MKLHQKIFLIIGCWLLTLSSISAQTNLVPNYSFEQNTRCPVNADYSYAVAWFDPTNASADLIDTCIHTTGMEIPNILLQTYIKRYPRTGGAMSGIFLMNQGTDCTNPSGTYREYIEVKLNDSLHFNHLYYVEFYAVLAQSMVYGIHNIGATFTQNKLQGGGSNYVFSNTPQIAPPNNICITDTNFQWSKICGYITGTGVEQYVTIGNFYSDNSTVKSIFNPNGAYCGAYYFIDDVSVIDITHLDTWDAGPDKFINYGDSVQIGNPNTDLSMFNWVTSTNSITYLSDSTDAHPWSKPAQTTTYYVTKTQGGNIFKDTVTVHVAGGSGIKQTASNLQITTYPNPANNILNITSSLQFTTSSLQLYNVLGAVVKTQTIKNTNEIIDVSDLPNGVYFVQVKTSTVTTTQKIVVQH